MGEGGDSEGDGSGGKGDGSGGEGDRALMGVDHEARGKQALQLLGVDRVVHEERVLPPLVVHEAAWGRLGHHTQCATADSRAARRAELAFFARTFRCWPGLPKDTCGGKQATLAATRRLPSICARTRTGSNIETKVS